MQRRGATRPEGDLATSNFVARFADYSMLARIAKLGACDVWLVEQVIPGRPPECFTLYTLGAEARGSRSLADALMTSGRCAMELEHASIARTKEVLSTEGGIGILEVSVRGRTLASIIAQMQRCNNSIPLWFSLHVARRVCDALKYVSDRLECQSSQTPLHHFALGTASVSVAESGAVMVTGFGAGGLDLAINAQFGDDPLSALRPLATVSSPSLVDAATLDVLAVAGILYDLLTLGANEPSLAARRKGSVAEPWTFVPPSQHSPWIPAAIDAILCRALALECGDRFRSLGQFEQVLGAYLEEHWGRIEDAALAVFVNLLGRSEFGEEGSNDSDSVYRALRGDSQCSPETSRLSLVPNTLRFEEPCPVTRRADALRHFDSEAQGALSSLSAPSRERVTEARVAPSTPRGVAPAHDWAAAVASCTGGEVDSPGRRAAATESATGGVHALFDRGLDCLRSGDLAGADEAWSKVLLLDPAHRAAAANLKRLRLGRVKPK